MHQLLKSLLKSPELLQVERIDFRRAPGGATILTGTDAPDITGILMDILHLAQALSRIIFVGARAAKVYTTPANLHRFHSSPRLKSSKQIRSSASTSDRPRCAL